MEFVAPFVNSVVILEVCPSGSRLGSAEFPLSGNVYNYGLLFQLEGGKPEGLGHQWDQLPPQVSNCILTGIIFMYSTDMKDNVSRTINSFRP